MKRIFTLTLVLFIVVFAVFIVGSPAMADPITYSIVDYPLWQTDRVTHLTDHVSGWIIADPTTGVIDSASFTITGGNGFAYTVASAAITTPYYVSITPTEIALPLASPEGFLRLEGPTGVSGINSSALLWWYTPADPWVVGTNDWASYSGQVGSRGSGPYFPTALYNPFADFESYSYVVATAEPAVPEPASLLLLGTGLVGLVGAARRRLRRS